MMLSLHQRLLLAASIVLAAFFAVTGLVLEKAYRDSAEQAVFDRLQGHVVALIAAIEQDGEGRVYLANALAEIRFFSPASGLYGQVSRHDGGDRWRSPSWPTTESFAVALAWGEQQRQQRLLASGQPVFVFSLGINWDGSTAPDQAYTFTVMELRQSFDEQLSAYRRLLWGWLLAVALGLLLVQGSILRWGLAPLRRVATELLAVQAGRQQGLQQDYPAELRGLTENLNAVLETQRCQLRRYRDGLGDLAHSLKTPLALLRGAAEAAPSSASAGTQEQLDLIEQMAQIVDYQLQRAAAAGRTALAVPVSVAALAIKVMAALDKVYYERAMVAECLVAADLQVAIDRQDLLELLGNLLDNAYKYGRQRLLLTATLVDENEGLVRVLECCIEDDGPGIDEALWDDVLQRGVRGDEATPGSGQGIGLAVSQDIAAAYGGSLIIGRSRWQGARVCVRLPLTAGQ